MPGRFRDVPAPAIQHVDLCVSNVERSRAFYLEVLGPLGLAEDVLFRSYRGTEEIVYLRFGEQNLGLRPADGGAHEYYGVGLEHLAFEVERREHVDEAYERCVALGAEIHFPPEEAADLRRLLRVLRLRPGRTPYRGLLRAAGAGRGEPLGLKNRGARPPGSRSRLTPRAGLAGIPGRRRSSASTRENRVRRARPSPSLSQEWPRTVLDVASPFGRLTE